MVPWTILEEQLPVPRNTAASKLGNFSVKCLNPEIISQSRLSLIVRVNIVLNRTVVVDSDWRFDNLCGSHLQSQSELCHVSWRYYTLDIDLIGQLFAMLFVVCQLSRYVIGYELLVIGNWCVSIRLLSQLTVFYC